MEKKKRTLQKVLIGMAAAVAVIAGIYLVGTGLMVRTDVHIGDYQLSEENNVMTLTAGVAGSMGYIRDVSVKQEDDALCLTFYSAFGGLNSNLGAKNQFDLVVGTEINRISVYGGAESGFVTVLEKNNQTGEWERVK